MRKGFFTKLATINIKKNKSTYIPYILTCVGCIAMMYMMFFIFHNSGLESMRGGTEIKSIMFLGIVVIAIFSFIFLLYSKSFLMKRRQKELGLYNILGMEKGHISKMMLLETIYTSLISLTVGLLVGILGSKLALLLLLKLVHIPAQFGFYISSAGIGACIVTFGGIFVVTLLNDMRKVHLSQPIELLRGGNVGEREPEAKWLMAVLGFVCLGSGYYIAVTTESPLEAITMFFLAVLLVMVGTYLLFTAGSIAILKMLRWKKSFYYKMKNFTSVSGMIYRMKQNAVGLASICILSTGVLLMLSTTVCMNFGMENMMETRYPQDINISLRGITLEEGRNARNAMTQAVEKEKIPYEKLVAEMHLSISCNYKDHEIIFKKVEGISDVTPEVLTVIPVEEYEKIHGTEAGISDGQLLAYQNGENPGKELTIMEESFQVNEWLKEWPLEANEEDTFGNIAIVVTENDFKKIDKMQKDIYQDYSSFLNLQIGIDVKGTKEDQLSYGNKVKEMVGKYLETGKLSESAWTMVEVRQENYESLYIMNGGLLFLGIFLGGLFLMGAAMIIYYKQISEGYEDKERFEIMQKVGMSRKEVKASIRQQILLVFFAPLLIAALHIVMAFPLVKRLLVLMSLANTELFILCTIGTILVFAVIYGLIYTLTAKSYYKIVERAM